VTGYMSSILTLVEIEKEILSQWCSRIEIAGGLRRKKENPHDIDFVVIPDDIESKTNILRYIKQSQLDSIRTGDNIVSYKVGNIGIDIYFTNKQSFGAMLLFLTGSSSYNIGLRKLAQSLGMKLNQYGLFKDGVCIASETEEDIYHALGKEWKSPELRGLSPAEVKRRYGISSSIRVLK